MIRSEFVIGVDIGGTCTDSVVIAADGTVTLAKAFSTPDDFSRGIIDSVGAAADQLNLSVRALLYQTRLFLHSTTIAENAVVNRALAPAGLIVNRGFDEILPAMRGGYGRWSGLTEDEKRNPIYTDKPPPLIPPARIRGIKERTASDGQRLIEINPVEIREAAKALLEAGARSIGVALLWSIVNDDSERAVAEIIREVVGDDIFVATSSDVAPTIGEYERTSTAALTASLGPVVRTYLKQLEAELKKEGFEGTVLIMQAYGGLVPSDRAMESPAGLIESGPVGGLIGCVHLGRLLGSDNIIAADMGGTTFKVGTVRGGMIEYQREPMVFRYHYSLPKMDVVSLGVAGGSIISIDESTGTPTVGPQSAGSFPGPVCYANGGVQLTVTDVDAILGYLNEDLFLSGRARLNIKAAHERFEEMVAKPLGSGDPLRTASDIYRLTNAKIYDLLHKTTIQRGLDPRDFALYSTGGTAGMHLPSIGAELGVREIVIPHSASVQGAFGLATSDVVHEELLTRPLRDPIDPARVDGIFATLTGRVQDQLDHEGFSKEDQKVALAIDMRYRRQVHIVTVPVEPLSGEDGFTLGALKLTLDRFEQLYTERYGPESAYREAGVEMVTFRVRGSGRVRRPGLKALDLGTAETVDALVERRSIYVPDLDHFVEADGYLFDKLQAGNRIDGPAVIWTPITTAVIGARQSVEIDGFKNLRIRTAKERS